MSGNLSMDRKGSIPARSFGACHWCGAQSVRLQYLMCNDCFGIADTIPSKTQILLRSADVKKRLGGNVTAKKITPELRAFVLEPKNRFPVERSYQDHWAVILSQLPTHVLPEDVHRYASDLMDKGADVPEEDEIVRMIGVEKFLYYVLKIAVLRNVLRLDTDEDEEGFCVVCWKPTISEEHMLCSSCRDDLAPDSSDDGPGPEEEVKPYMGMKTRDIVLGKRGRS